MILIKKKVFDSILYNTPCPSPETGGIIGCKNNIITSYYPDKGINNNRADCYQPSTSLLNEILVTWINQKIQFCGIYHSHYEGDIQLSVGDLKYIKNILFHIRSYSDSLLLPLVFPKHKIIFYKARLQEETLFVSNEMFKIII